MQGHPSNVTPLEMLAHASQQQGFPSNGYPGQSPSGHGSDSEGEKEGGSKKRKRNRVALSCTECRRRKIKCDRKIPCEGCIRRNDVKNCRWESDVQPQPFALNSTVKQLEARYNALEEFIVQRFGSSYPELSVILQQALAAHPTPDMPVAHSAPSHEGTPSRITLPPLQTTLPPLQAIPDEATRSLAHRGQSRISRTGIDLETEDAANVLEDMAIAASCHTDAADGPHKFASTTSSAYPYRPVELALGQTSVLLPAPYHEHDAGVALFSVDEVLNKIVAILPPREVVDKLVHTALTDTWIRGIVVKQVFFAEVKEFFEVFTTTLRQVDPAFLSALLTAMTAGFEILEESVIDICGIPIDELSRLAVLWFDGSQQCLHLANYMSHPQYRVVQTILLRWHPGMRAVPNTPIWTSIAIRHAQALNFHQLGADPHIMPRDSPGLPHGANATKRQLACRAWHALLFSDALASYRTCQFTVRSAADYTTGQPLNVNDVDLGNDIVVKERPESEFTEGALNKWKSNFGVNLGVLSLDHSPRCSDLCRRTFAQKVYAIITEPTNASYSSITEIDKEFRSTLKDVVHFGEFGEPEMRAVMTSACHYRLTRLHRPFAARGVTNPKYFPSTKAAVESGHAVLNTIKDLRSRKMWFVIMHALGAVIVLFHHIWLTSERGERLISPDDFWRDIRNALNFFEYCRGSRSSIAKSAASHAHTITTALGTALSNKPAGTPGSVGSSDSGETFGALLKRIGREVATGNPTLQAALATDAESPVTWNSMARTPPANASMSGNGTAQMNTQGAPARNLGESMTGDGLFLGVPNGSLAADDGLIGQMLADIALLGPSQRNLEVGGGAVDFDWAQLLGTEGF